MFYNPKMSLTDEFASLCSIQEALEVLAPLTNNPFLSDAYHNALDKRVSHLSNILSNPLMNVADMKKALTNALGNDNYDQDERFLLYNKDIVEKVVKAAVPELADKDLFFTVESNNMVKVTLKNECCYVRASTKSNNTVINITMSIKEKEFTDSIVTINDKTGPERFHVGVIKRIIDEGFPTMKSTGYSLRTEGSSYVDVYKNSVSYMIPLNTNPLRFIYIPFEMFNNLKIRFL